MLRAVARTTRMEDCIALNDGCRNITSNVAPSGDVSLFALSEKNGGDINFLAKYPQHKFFEVRPSTMFNL